MARILIRIDRGINGEMMKEERKYVAEGNVIVSSEEFNKLNDDMKDLVKDREKLKLEQGKLNQAIKDNMFLTTTRHVDYTHTHNTWGYRIGTYYLYDLSDNAEEILKPVLEQRVKEELEPITKELNEFKDMSVKEFKKWRKNNG